MEPVRVPPTSSEMEHGSQPEKPLPDRPRSPRSWAGVSPVTFVQVLIIIVALICLIMSLVPFSDWNDAGEDYEILMEFCAGLALAYLFAIIINGAELGARYFRSTHVGISPNWLLGLSIFVCLCCFAAFFTSVGIIGTKRRMDDLNDAYEDWCRDKQTRELVICPDGFYKREAHFIALIVLSFIVAFLQLFLCCICRKPDWNTRRSQRRAAVGVTEQA